jgi:hypothetical protein
MTSSNTISVLPPSHQTGRLRRSVVATSDTARATRAFEIPSSPTTCSISALVIARASAFSTSRACSSATRSRIKPTSRSS